MRLILSSNFPLKGNDRLMEYIKNALEIGTAKTAFITALGQIGEYEKFKECLVEYGLQTVEYLETANVTDSEDQELLNEFDIFYLHGGDPFKISRKIRRSGFYRFLKKREDSRTIIIGTSGSTMALSKDISLVSLLYPKALKMASAVPADATTGLGFFPYVVLPHFARYKKKKTVEMIKKYSKTNRVYTLYDGSAVVYGENNIEIIGPVVVYDNGSETIHN
jgi:peptidase E